MWRADIVADSVNAATGDRLTTFTLQYPRLPVHEHFLTHRMLCLAGDMRLEFDHPTPTASGRRVYTMRLDDFVDRWHHGARRARSRFSIRDRLRAMRIRQLNEDTGDILLATVADCFASGVKPVYVVSAGGRRVAGSADHRVLTPEGYRRIGDLVPGTSQIVVRKATKPAHERTDARRLLKIDGVWRTAWQRRVRARLLALHGGCQECGATEGLSVHHRVSVYERPDLALDEGNVVLLCRSCHREKHRRQGWQGSRRLMGVAVPVDAVEFRGIEPTYDLAVAGPFENFLANGVVVHNSRNTRSNRAISTARLAEQPVFVPEDWRLDDRRMRQERGLAPDVADGAGRLWMAAAVDATAWARRLAKLGVHRQTANRLIEPFRFTTTVATATDWPWWFRLRCAGDAQSETRKLARMMLEAYAASTPIAREAGRWHLPFVTPEDVDRTAGLTRPNADAYLCRLSTARCARVSTLTFEGRLDPDADLRLHDDLVAGQEWSPFEHAARAFAYDPGCWGYAANYRGWRSYRASFAGSYDASPLRPEEVEALLAGRRPPAPPAA